MLKIAAGFFIVLIVLFTVAYTFAVYHKKEILEKVTSSINKNISGNVSIGNINFTLFEKFPALSIRVNNILITDSLIQNHKDTLFKARSLAFQIKILKLLGGKVSFGSFILKDATVSILKTASGVSNSTLIKTQKDAFKGEKKKNGTSVPRLQNIILENVSFRLVDSSKMKFFGMKFVNTEIKMNQLDSVIDIGIKGEMSFTGLTFNTVKGGYLTDKNVLLNLNTNFNLESNVFEVKSGTLEVEEQLINLSGKFNFKASPTMHLHFDSESILSSVAFSMLPNLIAKKLSVYRLEKPVMVSVEVDGPIAPGSKPVVDVYFKSTDNTLSFAGRTFESLNLIGLFMNHMDSTKINDDHNSRVYLPVFTADLNGILPMKAKLIVSDIIEPVLYMKADFNLDKDDEAETLNSERFNVYSGKTDIHLDFKGPLVNYVDTPNNRLKADISGSVFMSNLSFDFIPTGDQFRNLNGSFNFDENDLNVDSLYLEMNKNSAFIKGSIKQFIAVLFLPNVKATAQLDMHAGTIDFNSFKKPANDSAAIKKAEKKKEAAKKKPKKNTVASTIDMLITRLELDFNFTAEKIIFERLVATDLKSELTIANDYIKFKNTSMKTAGGLFTFSGGITQLNNPVRSINISSNISNVDISKIMYSFNDFGQKALSYKQISGTVSAKVDFKAKLSKRYKILPASMSGNANVSIRNGELRGIEGFQQVQKYIFKNRDFSRIQFAEIKNKYTINQSIIDISKLELYSSVMTLFIEGKYDLKKMNTDLMIQIPFSNLERKEASERIDKADSTLKKGGSLYLRATNNKDGKIQMLPVIVRKKSGEKKNERSANVDSTSNEKKKKHP